MKQKVEKGTKLLNIFKSIFFITFVINIFLFAYKHESKVEHSNYKVLVQESEGSSNYVEYEGKVFPKSGYTFASYECQNGGTVTQVSRAKFSFMGSSDSCSLKFDIAHSNCTVTDTDSSGGGGNAQMSGLTLMMKNASQGEDDVSWFADTAANQNQAGVYTREGTSNDAYPIYYYRGAYGEVNNNLVFNNYCWKIVRTTSTGSIRIIYNGPAVNNTCPNQTGDSTMIGKYPFNNSYNDPKYVGYRYDNNGTMADSNLKITLDSWYTSNMSAVDNKIETSTYCNDMTTFSYEDLYEFYVILFGNADGLDQVIDNNYVYYCPMYRAKMGTLKTKCKNQNDEYSAKVGFLTLDEVMLAGRSFWNGMEDYLYNNNTYWLGTPSGFADSNSEKHSYVYVVSLNLWEISDRTVDESIGVRPVVSLSPNTSYTGTGTTTDPFIVN